MPTQRINDIELHYELTGDGDDTVVLVHGSWTDHLSWDFVVAILAERFRVVTYDRRGHSRSVGVSRTRFATSTRSGPRRAHRDTRPRRRHARRQLVRRARSLLGLAACRPDLVRCVIAHEPPLLGVAACTRHWKPS